jgi:hypothetical protein
MKDSKKLSKNIGFIGVGLCAACCLEPIVGVMFGVGSFTFLTGFVERQPRAIVIVNAKTVNR